MVFGRKLEDSRCKEGTPLPPVFLRRCANKAATAAACPAGSVQWACVERKLERKLPHIPDAPQ